MKKTDIFRSVTQSGIAWNHTKLPAAKSQLSKEANISLN